MFVEFVKAALIVCGVFVMAFGQRADDDK